MALSVEGQAFILVIAAGLCTMIGAAVVFFPFLANLAKPNILAMALSFAAGIMLYISLIDIYGKSIDGYVDDGYDDDKAYIYATLTFFGGCFVMFILDVFVEKLLEWDLARAQAKGSANVINASVMGSTVGDKEAVNKMRDEFENKVQTGGNDADPKLFRRTADQSDIESDIPKKLNGDDNELKKPQDDKGFALHTTEGEDGKQLKHMSWAMAAAIAIHNFPEGMVTYLAYTQDSGVGIALAIGIAIHNIPEGLCVAMPLYYSTGRRMYSFMWGTLSGLTEPFGALLVWVVLSNGISGTANGILFGIVSGMMTVISIDELLPTAHRYSSNPKSVTYMVIFGMLFIASSLMLFSI